MRKFSQNTFWKKILPTILLFVFIVQLANPFIAYAVVQTSGKFTSSDNKAKGTILDVSPGVFGTTAYNTSGSYANQGNFSYNIDSYMSKAGTAKLSGDTYIQSNGAGVIFKLEDRGQKHTNESDRVGTGYNDDVVTGIYYKVGDKYYEARFSVEIPKQGSDVTLDSVVSNLDLGGNGFTSQLFSSATNKDLSNLDRGEILSELQKKQKELDAASPADKPRLQAEYDQLKKEADQVTAGYKATGKQLDTTGPGLGSCASMFGAAAISAGTGGLFGSPGEHVLNCIAAIVNLVLEALTSVLIISANVFDYTIEKTVLEFKSWVAKDDGANGGIVSSGALEQPIKDVWNLIKNFSNLIFIATILYIAFKTIMDAQGFGDYKLLGKVIVFAFLINFSLLFTKLAIDASNIATIEVYKGITTSISGDKSKPLQSKIGEVVVNARDGNSQGNSLAAVFMNNMLITEIYDDRGKPITSGTIITSGLLGIIMIVVTTFVFLAIALAFLMRLIILVVLMMTSPIAFVSGIFPGLGEYGNKWVTALKAQCIFAPVFMIMVYIALQLLAGTNQIISKTNDWQSIVVSYAITIIAMVMCLVVAQQAGAHAGSIKVGKMLAGGATFGLAGFAGRRIIGGLGGGNLAKLGERMIASNNVAGRMAGRLFLNTGNKLKDSSFDVRNSSLGGAGQLGDGSKSSWNKVLKDQKDRAERERKIVEEHTKLTDEQKIEKEVYERTHKQNGEVANAHKARADAVAQEGAAKLAAQQALAQVINSTASDTQKTELAAKEAEINARNTTINTSTDPVAKAQAREELSRLENEKAAMINTVKAQAKISSPATLKNLEDAEKAEAKSIENREAANKKLEEQTIALQAEEIQLVKNLEKLNRLPKGIDDQIKAAEAGGRTDEANRLKAQRQSAIDTAQTRHGEIAGKGGIEEKNKQAYLEWLRGAASGTPIVGVNALSYGGSMHDELNKYILDGLKGSEARSMDAIIKAIKEANKQNSTGTPPPTTT